MRILWLRSYVAKREIGDPVFVVGNFGVLTCREWVSRATITLCEQLESLLSSFFMHGFPTPWKALLQCRL